MVDKNWNLSIEEKQFDSVTCEKYYRDYAIRKFIKRLKEELDERINYSTITGNKLVKEIIDKLAGDKLA